MIISSIPQGATVSIEGMDQSMTETTAKVKASLSKGRAGVHRQVRALRQPYRLGRLLARHRSLRR